MRDPRSNQPEIQKLLHEIKLQFEMLDDLGVSELPFEKAKTSSKTTATKEEELEKIRKDLGKCDRCKLCGDRSNIVFGEGSPDAKLMFIGEAPGRDEDIQGRPFVGRAGQLLTKMIEAMKLTREEVYIANIVKCRPPDNRYPEPEEVMTCYPFLLRQVRVIQPKVIVSLGNLATQTLLDTKTGITALHGNFQDFHGIKLMPTYHPAFLLRNPNMKKPCWEDLKKVMAELGLP